MEKTFTFSGNLRRNNGGQIIADTCGSDRDHLRDSVTDLATNRPQCRKTVESCFDDVIGKAGKLVVTIRFEEDSVGALPDAELVHTAETVKHHTSPLGAIEEAVIAVLEQSDAT